MTDHNKFISSSFVKGLLFGIGFMAVVIAGAHYITRLFTQPITVMIADKTTAGPETAKADFTKDLTIVSYLAYKEKKNRNQLNIFGKIKNTGGITWAGIEIQAELYYKGQYVDECQEYIRILKPDDEDNFKITCGECVDYTLPEYDKLTVRIAAAHHDDED